MNAYIHFVIFRRNTSAWFRYVVLMLLAGSAAVSAWSQTPAQYVKKGDMEAEKNHWDFAFSYYQKAAEIDTPSFDLTRKYAEAARRVHLYALALDLYAKNYQKDNGKIDPTGLFWMASMQKYLGQYEDAQRNFRKFLKKHKVGSPREIIERAEQEAKSAQWAMNHTEDELACCDQFLSPSLLSQCRNLDYNLAVLPEVLNSPESENGAFLESGHIYFSAYRDGRWSIYQSKMDQPDSIDLHLQTALPMEAVNSKDTDNANLCFFQDKAYFTRRKGDLTRIMVADWMDGKISAIHESDIFNAAGSVNTMPCLLKMGEKIYFFFVSDREGGEGGLDIWYATQEGEKWTEPKNAGKRINTPGDEIYPFAFGEHLFFSSDWHEGFGGQDIFFSHLDGKTFSPPQNLGVRFNSSLDDHSFRLFMQSEKDPLFVFASNRFSSDANRSQENACCSDLYAVRIKSLCNDSNQASTSSSESLRNLMSTLPVTLYFHNDEPVPDSWDTTTTISYGDAYRSYLEMIPRYLSENTRGLRDEKKEDAEEMTRDFFDLKVKQGMSDLKVFADLLYKELEAGKSMRISIRGFASPRAQSDYNLNLTKRRTASLVNYLREDSAQRFLPYIEGRSVNGAHLEFRLLPFGEMRSDKSVSDDLSDSKGSIYSRAASLERKIEIESLEYVAPIQRKAEFHIDSDSYDFGIIPKTGAVKHDFVISNTGNAPMQIDSVVAECGCTEPVLEKNLILPGEETILHIGFDPFGKKGKDIKHVAVFIAGEEPKVIRIEAEREK